MTLPLLVVLAMVLAATMRVPKPIAKPPHHFLCAYALPVP